MDIIGDTIDRRTALPADALCEAALAGFIHDLNCRSIAVVDGHRPIAIVHRESFLARMERTGAADRPILEIAEPDPLIVEAGEVARAFVERMLGERPAALLEGFIVCEDGAYAGVCDLAWLLPILSRRREGVGLVERICAEVREPIVHALAATDGLKRLRLPEGATQHLETIAEAAEAALSLLDVAAELQRADSGRLQVATAPRRLQELMDEIGARWTGQAETAGVTLLVSYDGTPDIAAMVDSSRLMQVFDALIGHAIAHAGRGVVEASLQVRAAASSGFVLTGRVRDNSAAYTPGYLAQMFRGPSDAALAGGMGVQLELMLADRAIAAMSGKLEAKANQGAGLTVAFEFAAADGHGHGVESAVIDETPGRSAHILVVDDNATNRMVVEALCEMFDCSTESVVDGMEAVEAARAGRYDVILMDIKMPRMDGVTAAREIRKLPPPAGAVPIIALTANADTDEVAQYLAAGMRCVVEKPIKPERLLEALDGALSDRLDRSAAAA
ncbi:MAG TPA: response regulator [Caulobacteraceae bacterium]|jgi:CheY-like chemotaxis protein|nr:response regulator [Caulobacteraceae bacterium]